MNWQRLIKMARRQTRGDAMRRRRYRPGVTSLEDRVLLTLTTFMIDPTQSSISLQGSYLTYSGAQIPIMEQGPGALTTTYQGPLATDMDVVNGTINFMGPDGGTAVSANISGNWRPGAGGVPGATDPANYGGTLTVLLSPIYGAIRNIIGSFPTNGPVTLTNQGGGAYSFPSNQTVEIDSGVLDYETPDSLYGSGETSVTGSAGQNQAANGSVQDNGDGTFTITVPVSYSYFYDLGGGASITLQANGTLVGTGTPGTTASHPGVRQAAIAQSGGNQWSGGTVLLISPAGSAATGLSNPAPASDASAAPLSVASSDSAASHPDTPAGGDSLAALDAVFVDPVLGL
jgi:hypothetical protein